MAMEKEKSPEVVPGSGRRGWALMALLAMYPFIAGFIYSLQAPFYPIEAQGKGVSVTVIGLVYGVYELASIFMSLVVGALLSRIGLASGLHLGLLFTGIGTIGLGLLSFITDRTAFVALSVIMRLIQSVGASFRGISTVSLATLAFPKAIGATVASLESISRLGGCLGTVAGGAVMQVSGFLTTFGLSGGAVLAVLPISMIMLRNMDAVKVKVNNDPQGQGQPLPGPDLLQESKTMPPAVTAKTPASRKIGLCTLLRSPSIALPVYLLVCSGGSQGFAMSVMEPNLQQFSPTPLQIGLIFMCSAGAFLLTSPALGYFYDRLKARPAALFRTQLTAPVLLLLAFTIMGPVRFAPFEPSIPLTAVGLALLGIAYGSASSSSYLIAVQNGKALASTEADELRVHELISGIWRAALSMGFFIAPSVSGALYDTIGFRNQCLFIVGLQAFNVLLLTACGCRTRTEESQSKSRN